MQNKRCGAFLTLLMAVGLGLLLLPVTAAWAAQVTLQWDPNDPAPDGYRLFLCGGEGSYDFNQPLFDGQTTSHTVAGLSEGATYRFVVRAYQGDSESGNSNEVTYTVPAMPADEGGDDPANDDGDQQADDPSEGGDPTDPPPAEDGDNDAEAGPGDEGDNDTDEQPPAPSPVNTAPEQPIVVPVELDAHGLAGLTPMLNVGPYFNADNDSHRETEYQISLLDNPEHSEFSAHVVFQRSFSRSLHQLRVPQNVLDPDSTYHWRARFIDSRGAMSAWSEWSSFTTIDHQTAGIDTDGIPYDQAIDQWTVIDDPAVLEEIHTARLQGVDTTDPFNPQVALQILGENGTLAGMRSLMDAELPSGDNCPENLTGVVSFRIHLDSVGDTALVKVHFSQPAPADAHWYKFDPDQGWTVYPYATFSADRRSVVLELEDGGTGDMDGVANGVIIDPSGLGYSTRAVDGSGGGSAAAAGGSGGCFIAVAHDGDRPPGLGLHGAIMVAGLIALLSGILLWRRR